MNPFSYMILFDLKYPRPTRHILQTSLSVKTSLMFCNFLGFLNISNTATMQNIHPKLENHFHNKMLKKNLESISLKSLNKVQAANERVYIVKSEV